MFDKYCVCGLFRDIDSISGYTALMEGWLVIYELERICKKLLVG
jgi:hypothetical protein